MKIRALLADDHKIVREGLRSLLEKQPDIEVIAEAEDGRNALRLAQEMLPDVIIMDVAMPGLNGLEATRRIKKECPGAKVSGGISNISFSFRGNDKVREAMHSAFLYHAIKAGLDMGIVNAGQLEIYEDIETELRELKQEKYWAQQALRRNDKAGYLYYRNEMLAIQEFIICHLKNEAVI